MSVIESIIGANSIARASLRVHALLSGVLLVVAITLGLGRMFWPLFENPNDLKFFGYLDAWCYSGPGFYYVDRVEHDGELPLWNPLMFCGQPIAGNPQYAIFYPPNVVRGWLTPHPTPWRTNVGIVALLYVHVLWAGAGAYLFARAHRLSRLAACCTALVFVFSAPYTQRLFLHHQIIMVVSWLPWIFFLLRKGMQAGSLRRALGWFALLGLAYAMELLAGSPQIAFFAGFSLVLYWLISRAQDLALDLFARKRGTAVAGLRRVTRDVALGVITVTITAAVAAALLVPAAGLIRETPRVSDAGAKIEKEPSREVWTLGELLSVYLGSTNHESVKATGASALLVALLGLFSVSRRDAIMFGLMALLLIDASLNESRFMLGAVAAAAPFPISAPGRMMLMGVLPLSLLAGMGIDVLRWPMDSRLLRGAASAACLAVGVYMIQTMYIQLDLMANNNPPLHLPVRIAGMAAATLAVLLVGIWRPSRGALAVVAALLMISEPIVWRAAWSYRLAASPEYFYQGTREAIAGRPEFDLENSRESLRNPNVALYTLTAQVNGYDPLQLRGFKEMVAPIPDNGFWRGVVESARSSTLPNVLLKRSFWLQQQYATGPLPERPAMFPATTTAFLIDPVGLHVPEVARSEVSTRPYSSDVQRISLMTGEHAFAAGAGVDGPPLRLALPAYNSDRHASLHFRLVSDCSAEIEVRMPENVKRGAAQIARLIWLHQDAAQPQDFDVPLPDFPLTFLEIQPYYMRSGDKLLIDNIDLVLDNEDENERIRIVGRSANSVEVELRDLPAYRILSFIDFAYPGWHAYVDGVEVPIFRAFSFFKAVEVPGGTHRVRFEFRQPSVLAGIGISLAAVAATVALGLWGLWPAPRRSPAARA